MSQPPTPPPPPDLFTQMVDRLNGIEGEPRASVLITHLYIEYLMDLIIRKKIAKPDKIIKFGFATKLKLVESFGLLPANLIKNIDELNEIRTLFAHRIDIESPDFEKKFLERLKRFDWYNELNETERIPNHGIFSMLSIRLYHTLNGYYNQIPANAPQT
jgi:hypothetical protein